MGTVEAQGFDRVFCGRVPTEPFAVMLFEEVVGKIAGAQIDESDLYTAEFRGWPLDSFGPVADVAGPVEVVVLHA